MSKLPDNFDGSFSPDDLALAMMGFGLPQEEEPEPADDDDPQVAPYHDMESIEFHLWMIEEAEKEQARRKSQKAAAEAKEK